MDLNDFIKKENIQKKNKEIILNVAFLLIKSYWKKIKFLIRCFNMQNKTF